MDTEASPARQVIVALSPVAAFSPTVTVALQLPVTD
jgi:hypothetical protein